VKPPSVPGAASLEVSSLLESALDLHQGGRPAEAARLYRQILARAPADRVTRRLLGAIGRGATEREFAEGHNSLGVAYFQADQPDRAAAAHRRAIALSPDFAEAYNNLGVNLGRLRRLDEAAEAYGRAIVLKPDLAAAHHNLGALLAEQARAADAEASFRRAIALEPDMAETHSDLGVVLKIQGRLEAARDAFRRAIALKPGMVATHYHLATLGPGLAGEADLEAALSLLNGAGREGSALNPSARGRLLFALGRALEDRGDFHQAFARLAEANAIRRAERPFDVATLEAHLERVAEVFTPGLLERLAGQGDPSRRPVFIFGMARSGTTLVEQIISAHPAVHGAGEIANLASLVARIRGREGKTFPDWAADIDGGDCRSIGKAYLDSLPPPGAGEARLTDKRLHSFEHLGLIQLCLPNATLIHCRRDPRDVCFSLYALDFERGMDYAFDLADLGRYWRAYERVMDHWRAVLPPGRMLEVPYEAVVDDLEAWARRLIDHCGLEWDEACLRFHQSQREVRTASNVQVRRPIYAASVGRWRRFERHLGPLMEALEQTPTRWYHLVGDDLP
jgi:Flp pilus assembly protein TadD